MSMEEHKDYIWTFHGPYWLR